MYKIFTITPYSSKLIVIIDKDPYVAVEEFNNDMPGMDIEWGEGYTGLTYEQLHKGNKLVPKGQYIIVVLPNRRKNIIDTIAHESVHVVNYLFNYIGTELDSDNDESRAYLTGWVAGRIWETLIEFNKRKTKKK